MLHTDALVHTHILNSINFAALLSFILVKALAACSRLCNHVCICVQGARGEPEGATVVTREGE